MIFICRIKFILKKFSQSRLTLIQISKVENICLKNTNEITTEFNVLTMKTLLDSNLHFVIELHYFMRRKQTFCVK
jgi:hypothetical protein